MSPSGVKTYRKIDSIRAYNEPNEESESTAFHYHKTCYSGFTSAWQKLVIPNRNRLFPTGIACTGKATCLLMQIDVSDEVMEPAKKDFVMRSRLANLIDLVAGDAIFHPQSKVEFLRKAKKGQSDEATKPETICFKKLLDEIRLGLVRGGVYLLTDVYERYSFLLEVEFGLSTEPYKDCKKGFKLTLENSLPGEIQFVPQLDPNKSQLLFAAKPNKTFLQILKCRSDALEEKHSEQSLFSMLPSAAETDSYLSVLHSFGDKK